MVEHIDTAIQCFSFWCLVWLRMCVAVRHDNDLLGKQHLPAPTPWNIQQLTITAEFLRFHNILMDIAWSPSTDDYHPREAKARLQSWHASETTEAAPRTTSLVN